MKRRRKEPPSTPFDANGPRRTVSATPTVTPSEDWPQTFEQIQSRTFDRTFAGYDRSQLQLFLTVAADLIDSLERDRPVPKEFTMAESYSDQIRQWKFRVRALGADMRQVDRYLDGLVDHVEKLERRRHA